MSKRKGRHYEQELTRSFRNDGWYARRTASSGGGHDNEMPDIEAAKDGRILVMELKFSSDGRAYVQPEKVEGLHWLANHLDAERYLVLRVKRDTTYYAWHPADVPRTDTGRYVLHRDIDDPILFFD